MKASHSERERLRRATWHARASQEWVSTGQNTPVPSGATPTSVPPPEKKTLSRHRHRAEPQISVRLATSRRRNLSSPFEVASEVPSGLKASLRTGLCVFRGAPMGRPVRAFQEDLS